MGRRPARNYYDTMAKDKNKKLTRSLTRKAFNTFFWLVRHMPYTLVMGIAGATMTGVYPFLIRLRRTAKESLTIAFGKEKSPRQIARIQKKCFRNMGYGMVEMIYYLTHPENVSAMVYMEGREHLDEALKRGKGAIVTVAHFGNFPLMMFYCALQGYKVSSIIRPSRDPKMEEMLLKLRTDSGLNTIYAQPRKKCVSECLEVLRRNEVLFVPLDQHSGTAGSVLVDFFGRKAATATGPIVLSKRTGAPILSMFITRKENGMQRVFVEPPIKLSEDPDNEKMLQTNVQRITDTIERVVREYPHEWGWMHRRWKINPATHNWQKKKRVQST